MNSGKAEASSEGGCVGVEGEQCLYKRRNAEDKWHVVPYVVLKREAKSVFRVSGSLGLAEGEQCL